MNQVELIMPKMGESIAEATILKWLKKEGDSIEMDEPVLEIATDKVDSEVPASNSGIMGKIFFNEGDVVPVGKAIAIIHTGGAENNAPSNNSVTAAVEVPYTPAVALSQPESNSNISSISNSDSDRFYSPLVMNIAKSEKISMTELESINGSGKEGRVTKKDILDYVDAKSKGQINVALPQNIETAPLNGSANSNAPTPPLPKSSPVTSTIQAPDVQLYPGDEIVEMDRMRKLIADHMVMSVHVSPHVTSFVEADVTNLVLWRDKNKKEFEKREGEKITFTPIFIEAVVKAIKDFPNINVSVSGNSVIKRKSINIGMAAALPSGNLIVPVIKNADTKNLIGLTREVNDFANRARNNQLKPDDIQGGTFTVTNVGTFGNVMGTPIINQPQVAILAVGAIRKKPVVLETPQGDVIAIRQMMFLSLSYDHRVVDGMLGGSFLRRIADYLEGFDLNRTI